MLGEQQSETGERTRDKWWQILLVISVVGALALLGGMTINTPTASAPGRFRWIR